MCPQKHRDITLRNKGEGGRKSFHPKYVNKIIQRHFPLTPGKSRKLNH